MSQGRHQDPKHHLRRWPQRILPFAHCRPLSHRAHPLDPPQIHTLRPRRLPPSDDTSRQRIRDAAGCCQDTITAESGANNRRGPRWARDCCRGDGPGKGASGVCGGAEEDIEGGGRAVDCVGDYRRDELEQGLLVAKGVIFDRGCPCVRLWLHTKGMHRSFETDDHSNRDCIN